VQTQGGQGKKEADVARLIRTILLGVGAGVAMTLGLFMTGAVAARLVYGPQMVPEGKFTAEQINAAYFLWTKLLIGVFFGVLLSVLYERLPLARRITKAREGLWYAVLLWLVVYLWARWREEARLERSRDRGGSCPQSRLETFTATSGLWIWSLGTSRRR
jgi:hypothetical protein